MIKKFTLILKNLKRLNFLKGVMIMFWIDIINAGVNKNLDTIIRLVISDNPLIE